MTWTASEVTRSDKRTWTVADERAALDSFLDWHRQTLLRKCAGLTEAQLKQRSVEPSDLSLLGLVRHMTNVERGWFWDFAGQMVIFYSEGDDPAAEWTDFRDVDSADPAADLVMFHETCQRSRELVADRDLDDTFTEEHGHTFSLRWVYLHMIEEYARHNGHADLLRERIDGATGQ
jgi:uncharacterized damage-inducible protein DinB